MDPVSGARSVVICVEGMTCNSCVQSIEQHIGKLSGVHYIRVSLEDKNATIIYNAKQQTPQSLQEAIDDMGFDAAPGDKDPQVVLSQTAFFSVPAHSAPTCDELRMNLLKTKGILDAKSSSDKKSLAVTFLPSVINREQINQAVPGLSSNNVTHERNPGTSDDPNLSHTGDVVLRLKVEGMTCHSCTSTIEGKVGKLQGVARIKVSLDNQEAIVVYQPHLITSEDIMSQIEAAGFSASLKKQPKPLRLGAIDVERLKSAQTQSSEANPEGTPKERTTVFRVDGMHCNSCVFNIQSAISALPAVSHVSVSLEERSATVTYNPSSISADALRRAIEALSPGTFKVSLLEGHENAGLLDIPKSPVKPLPRAANHFGSHPLNHVTIIHIEGMTCNSCVQSIEGGVSQKPGVRSVSVSLQNGSGTIEYDPTLTSPEDLRNAIEEMGFEASVTVPPNPEPLVMITQPSQDRPPEPHDRKRSNLSPSHNKKDLNEPSKCYIQITGMTCASCVANIERNLKREDGISSVLVALMAGKAEVRYNPDLIQPSDIAELIRELGFGAIVLENYSEGDGVLELVVSKPFM